MLFRSEVLTSNATNARSNSQFWLKFGVAYRDDVIIYIHRVFDHDFLSRGIFLVDNDRLDWITKCIGCHPRPGDVIRPTKQLVDDVLVTQKVGDDTVIGLALDVIEKNWAATIEFFLQ